MAALPAESMLQRGAAAFPRAQLRWALEHGRLRAHYQPIVRLADLALVGHEALARLHMPGGSLLPAEAFIAIAARLGLEPRIDAAISRLVIETGADSKVFINCSSAFLADPAAIDGLARLHRAWAGGLAAPQPAPWVLEITERNLDVEPQRLLGTMQPLLDLGFELALDDFGGPQSAITHLIGLPIRYLKLDRSLVHAAVHDDLRAGHVLRHLLALVHELDILSVAEGIETPQMLHRMRDFGVHLGQGYFIGLPGELGRR